MTKEGKWNVDEETNIIWNNQRVVKAQDTLPGARS